MLVYLHPRNLLLVTLSGSEKSSKAISEFIRSRFKAAKENNSFILHYSEIYNLLQCSLDTNGPLVVFGKTSNFAIFTLKHSKPSLSEFLIESTVSNLVNCQICIIHGSNSLSMNFLAHLVQSNLNTENNVIENTELILENVLVNEFIICSKLATRQASSEPTSKDPALNNNPNPYSVLLTEDFENDEKFWDKILS